MRELFAIGLRWCAGLPTAGDSPRWRAVRGACFDAAVPCWAVLALGALRDLALAAARARGWL